MTLAAAQMVYTVPEAAKALRCSKNTVLALIHDGRLRAIKLGTRAYRIPAEALETLLKGPADGR